MKMIKALDVSSNQGKIDWKYAKAGIDYVILRSVLKSGKTDARFAENVKTLNEIQMPYDVYKYVYAQNIEEINQEVFGTIKCIQDNGAKCKRIWLDIEDDSLQALGRSALTTLIQTGIDAILKNGFYAGVYTGYNCLREKWFDLPDVPLWIARYPFSTIYDINSDIPDTSFVSDYDWTGWQYTSRAYIDGISYFCDLSVFDEDILTPFWSDKSVYLENLIYGESIAAALEEIGIDGSFENRCRIALRNGMGNYSGTAEQNLELLRRLRNGELLKI